MFYIVIESQITSSGAFAAITNKYDDINSAYAKLYTILAAAAVSDIPYHAAFIMRDDLVCIEGRAFDRREKEVTD